MKLQFRKTFVLIATLCMALAISIGIGGVTAAAAEGSTLSLTLLGNSTIYLQKGTEYKEFGATAQDTVEGDLTEKIVIDSSKVKKDTVGTYTVSYSVSNNSSESASATRTVIVFDAIQDETLKTYTSSSYSSHTLKKIAQLSDGGFILYGEDYGRTPTSYNGHTPDEYTARVDKDFNLVWSKCEFLYGTDYARDLVVTSEHVVTLSYNNSSGDNFVTVRNLADGTEKKSYQMDSNYTYIDQPSENSYIVYGGGTSYSILTYDAESNEFTSAEHATEYQLNNAFVLNNSLYAVQSDGSWSKLALDTEELTEGKWDLTVSSAKYWVTDSEIYFCSYNSNRNTLYRLDAEMNILNTFTLKGTAVQEVCAFNDTVLVKAGSEIIILDRDLEKIGLAKTQYNFTANDMILGTDGKVYYVGQYRDSYYYYCGVSILSNITIFTNIKELHSELNVPIDYRSGVDIVDPVGKSLGTCTYDDSQVDITKAGNYKVYYTFTAIDDEGIKTYYVGRDIIVDPTTTLEEGAVYRGSTTVDVKGGSVTINGAEYSYGDTYNIPGESQMVITGENGYSKTINFEIELVVEGVEDGNTYYTPVTPTISGGTVTLDGEKYESGTPISTKGNHTLTITGANGFSKSITFTIEPTILGVEDGQTYTETLRPNINAENMTLNGVEYQNEPIENCGNYALVITGTNGYSKTISFVIATVVSDLADEGTYDGSVTPSFTKGKATLNGEEYISGTPVTTPGMNTLIITGENDYSLTYTFTVNLKVENVSGGETYIGEVTPVISGGTITLNGVPYTSGTKIDIPGYYTITVLGAADFKKDIHFIVKPSEVNVEQGATYHRSVIPAVSKGTLTLNDEPYISGSVLNKSGKYTLVILGENGYLESITFTLVAGANVEEGMHYHEAVTLQFVGTATLNEEPVDPETVLEKVGNYQLKLVDGESTFTYNFVIEPDYSIFEDRITSCVIDFENCTLKLDGEAIENAVEVTEVGNYTLTVEGENGYTKTIAFAICAQTNVEEGGEYASGYTVNAVGGTITLDGEEFSDGTSLTDVGTYTLQIIGKNEYEETIVFHIVPEIAGIGNASVYYGSVTPEIIGGTLTLNGEDYTSGTEIPEEGVYQLLISGVGGYEQTINFVVLSEEFEVKGNGIYTQTVSITHDVCDMEINGTSYSVGTAIDTMGENTLTLIYNGERTDITFYIIPSIDGVEEGGEYDGTVTPSSEWGNLVLDGKVYESGTPVTEIGHHTLALANLNGYNYEITFTVKEVWENIEAGGTYEYSVVPKVANGKLYLDGNAYSSGNTVEAVGHHTIKLVGTNGYESGITFTVTERVTGLEDGMEYTGSVSPSISHATLYLDGAPYSSGTSIREVGYHTLKVEGTNEYVSEHEFTILPTFSGVTENEETTSYVRFYCDHATLKLNGEAYTQGTYIYDIGNHEIEIVGTNGYSKIIRFTRKESTSIADGAEYAYSKSVSVDYLSNFKSTVVKLDDESLTSTKTVYFIGHHTLTIEGVNGYKTEMTFTVPAKWSGVTNGTNYTSRTGTRLILNSSSSSSSVLSEDRYEKILLDGQDYTNNTYFYTVGNHKFEIYGANGYKETVEFVIDPVVSADEGTRILPVIYLNNTNTFQDENTYVLLDGQPYVLNSTIDEVGYHTLKVVGVGGYEKEYKTTVIPTVNDIEDGETYAGIVTPNIERCELELDGEAYDSGTPIVAVGHHTLEMHGTNGYVLRYSFTVTPLHVEDYSGKTFVKEVAIDTIEHAALYLDGVPYDGEKIISLGHHTVKIEGANGYEQFFNFSITEEPVLKDTAGYREFTNGFTSEYMVNITIPGAELTIDGIVYISATDYYTVGLHYLRIVGKGGYEKEYTFTLTERINGLVSGQAYSSLELNCGHASLQLNGEPVDDLTDVNIVGNYTLVVVGTNGYTSEYRFTIDLDLKNVENERVYNAPLTPIVNAKTVYLNDMPFSSGTTVSDVGYHSMRIEGAGGYSHEISFTLEAKIEGVADGGQYQTDVIPTYHNGTVTLDGEAFTSGTPILRSNIGIHKLKVVGVGGYEKEYVFTIIPDVANIVAGGTYQGSVSPVINGGTFQLNGQGIDLNRPIDTIGNNTLKILGTNGYVLEIAFTVEPVIEDLADSYLQSFTPNVIGGGMTMKLNGNSYTKGTKIETVGHNKLTVSGHGGYSKAFTFTIMPLITGIESGSVVFGSVRIEVSPSAPLTIDGISYTNNTSYTTVGNHTLKITGVNGYEHTLVFTLKEDSSAVSEGQYKGVFKMTFDEDNYGILIDGANYTSGANYYQIGYHDLTLVGANGYTSTYSITVTPLLNGVDDKGEYNEQVSITTNNGNIYIDSTLYRAGTAYKKVGNHTLTMTGTGAYKFLITFTVTPKVTGIAEGGEYENTASWIIPSDCTASLDGVSVNVNSSTTIIGEHTIVISGANGYQTDITFTITVDVSTYADDLKKFNYIDTDLDLYIDGEKYAAGAKFDRVGNHTLECRGSNGYVSRAEFTIEYTYKGNADYKYQGSAVIDIPNATLFVNGTQVENLTKIDSIGNNIITIKGTNGYEKSLEIFIAPILTIEDGEVRNQKFEIKKLNAAMYLDGVAISGDTVVKKHGTHTLKIEGVNGYVREITFTFNNPNIDYVIMFSAVIGAAAVAFVVIMILRKKVL